MTPLVCGDDVQSCGKAEPDSRNEWIREADAREIEVGVGPQKRAHLILRCQECRDCVVERWRAPRPDRTRRPRLGAGFHGWFEKPHEPSPNETRPRGTMPQTTIAACSSGRWPHGAEVDGVGSGQVVETFCDAPRAGIRAPGASCLRQAGNQRPCVTLRPVQRVFQYLKVRREGGAHLPYRRLRKTVLSPTDPFGVLDG